jgi:hypothetical protein
MRHSVLQFDWDEVHGEFLRSSLGVNALHMDDGTIVFEAIVFHLRNCALHISVSVDTDEMIISKLDLSDPLLTAYAETVDIPFMSVFNGKKLGWCWVGRNYRGYKDCFIVSFSDLDPQIMFVGMAATVHTYLLKQQ